MVTKQQLITPSTFSKTSKNYRGVLTKEEAQERIDVDKERIGSASLTVISSLKKNCFFFSDDHCFGVGIYEIKEKGFVPSTSQMPQQVTPREILPSGIVNTAEEYISIFHKDEKQITSVEELLEILNS